MTGNVERLSVRPIEIAAPVEMAPELPLVPAAPPINVVPIEALRPLAEQIAAQAATRAAQATAQSLGVGLVRIWAGIGTVLAIRLLLLLSILGAFALAWLAMEYRDIASLCVLIAYAVLVVLPMVYLSRFNRADSRGE